MKLVVRGTAPEEPPVEVWIDRGFDDSLVVRAKREGVPMMNLVTLRPDGSIKLCLGIDPRLGFRRDALGRVIVDNAD
jgi:hypothetical protein